MQFEQVLDFEDYSALDLENYIRNNHSSNSFIVDSMRGVHTFKANWPRKTTD